MDAAEMERLIAKISWEYIPATIRTQDNNLISLLLHPPTPKEQSKAAMIYSLEYQRGIVLGLPSEKDAITDMIITEQWNPETDIQIEGLRKDIHNIRRGLLDFVFNKTKLERARSLLRRAEKALIERLNKKHNLLQNTAEANALILQQRYLISYITELEEGRPFWSTETDFEEFSDINIVIQLCELFFIKSRISTKFIRELARSQQWRMYWEIAKNTNDLFVNSVVSWSANQIDLARWSTIYDSVYDAYERPSKDIIVDDDLLDSWFIRQGDKIDNKTQTDMAPTSNRSGRNEEFIMADREGAKHIYKMNDPTVRAQIKARQKVLNQQGTVREQDMPDSQRTMKQQLIGKQNKHIKDITRR